MSNVHRFRFPATRRLRSSGEFKGVFGSGVFAADDVLVINGRRRTTLMSSNNQDDRSSPHGSMSGSTKLGAETRLGLSIGTVVGNAPCRNRWKRLIREAFRLNQHQLPTGWDLVVRPKKGAVPDFRRVCNSLVALAKRIDNKAHRK